MHELAVTLEALGEKKQQNSQMYPRGWGGGG